MNKRKTGKSISFRPYPNTLGILFKSRSLSSISEESPLTDTSFRLEANNMATPPSEQPNTVGNPIPNFPLRFSLESLRIPDAIKDLPTYEGNPRLLNEFINNVEEILLHIRACDATPQGQILLRAIRNKIIGQANEVLNMYGTPLIWDDIKQNLILHYSDKRTETSLIRDLHNIRQKFNNVEKFYSEIIEIQAALLNNIQIHERDERVVRSKIELYSEMCLNSFLIGLREPLGSTIRASKPESLAEAFALCIKEQNIFYMKSEPSRFQRNWQPKANNYFRNNNNFHRYTPAQRTYSQHRNQIPSYNTQPLFQRQNNYQNSSVNQNPYFPNQYNAQNPFRNHNNYNQYSKPEPMDTSSTHIKTQAPTQRSFRTDQTMRSITPRRPEFQKNELFNFQHSNPLEPLPPNNGYKQNLDEYQDPRGILVNIEDNQNFRHPASNHQQDT